MATGDDVRGHDGEELVPGKRLEKAVVHLIVGLRGEVPPQRPPVQPLEPGDLQELDEDGQQLALQSSSPVLRPKPKKVL